MKRRLFNKLMMSVPFLTLSKFKPPKNVVLIADGVKDRSGEYCYPEDIIIETFSGMVTRNHSEIVGKCQLEWQGNSLVIVNYSGEKIEGIPSIRGLCKPEKGRMTKFDLVAVGICDSPNQDCRIQKISLG